MRFRITPNQSRRHAFFRALLASRAWALDGCCKERFELPVRDRTESKGSGSAITVSIGIADFSVARPDRPASLVEAADAALYVAKEAGRDRAEIAKAPSRRRNGTGIEAFFD